MPPPSSPPILRLPVLPPELWQLVLSFYFAEPPPTNYVTQKHLYLPHSRLALVCQAWREPVQRALFRRLVLKVGPNGMVEFGEILGEVSKLGRYIDNLELTVKEGERGSWDLATLNPIFKAMTRVRTLKLDLDVPSDCFFRLSLRLSELSTAQSISIQLRNCRMDIRLDRLVFRWLLCATPNIATLELQNEFVEAWNPCPIPFGGPLEIKMPLNRFPSLKNLYKLSLIGWEMTNRFYLCNILSHSTLRQITDVSLNSDTPPLWSYRFPSFNRDLFDLLGSRIQTLAFPGSGMTDMQVGEILDRCQNLTTLIVGENGQVVRNFPENLDTIEILGGSKWGITDTLMWWLFDYDAEPLAKGLKTVRVARPVSDEVRLVRSFAQLNVELVLIW